MRIAHVTATFPPYFGGTGMVCYYSALELARRGHEVTVFTASMPGNDNDYEDPPEITVRRLPPLIQIGNAPLIPGIIAALKGFDLIHLHHPFIFGSELVSIAARLLHTPMVVTHHNDLIGDGGRRYLFDAYTAVSSRLVFGTCKKIIAVSLDHFQEGRLGRIARERKDDVVEIPNGVDTELFCPGINPQQSRHHWCIAEGGFNVLFVGALDRAHYYRRVDLLIEAVARLKNPDARLIIVGEGDRMGAYRDMSARANIQVNTHFLGKVSHQVLPSVYSLADVVVLPSQIQESFGMVLIEAMACAKAVIASNLPGARTVVNDGVDGLMVRPNDVNDLVEKLRLLIADPDRARQMGVNGRAKVVEKYRWPRIGALLERVYADALAG